MLEDERVRFTHPLLASLCYEQAPPWKRRAVARAPGDGRRATPRSGRATSRSLPTAPTPASPAELDAAARARRRPRSDGGGGRAGRARREAHAAEDGAGAAPASARRGRLPSPRRGFRAGDGTARGTGRRAAAAAWSAPTCCTPAPLIGRDDLPTRARLAEQALRDAGDDDDAARRSSGSCRSTGGSWAAFLRVCGTLARDWRAPSVWATRACWRWRSPAPVSWRRWRAEVTPGLLERGAEIEAGLDEPLLFIESPSFMLAVNLIGHGRAGPRAVDAGGLHPVGNGARGRAHAPVGDPAAHHRRGATRVASSAHSTVRPRRAPSRSRHTRRSTAGWSSHFAAPVEADIGLVEQARRSAEEGLRCARSVSDEVYTCGNLAALGHLELVLGRHAGRPRTTSANCRNASPVPAISARTRTAPRMPSRR